MVAEITFKVAVITSSVVKTTFVVADIIFKVAVITYRWSRSFLINGSRECEFNNKYVYHMK